MENNTIIKALLILATISLVLGCQGVQRDTSIDIHQINNISDLSENLAGEMILFSKNVNNQTVVNIKKIGRYENKNFALKREGNNPELSGDGLFILFDSSKTIGGESHKGIWIHDVQDHTEHSVIVWPEKFTDVHISQPNFAPDGNSLIFSVTWLDEEEIGVATVNLDGSDLRIISKVKNDLNDSPRYSPDGNKIIVICAGRDKDTGQPGFMLCIMDSDGSNRKLLTEDGDVHGSYLFTPDSQKIVYSESEWGGIFDFRNRPYYRINIMDTDGNNKSTILDWDRPVRVMEISESGQEIIVLENDRDGMPTRLFVINRDGTNLRHLAYFDDFLADWFPEDN